MTENLSFNEEDLFKEILNKALEETVTDREAFSQLVDNVLDDHAMWGEVHDDQDLENVASKMKDRFSEYEVELNKKVA